MSLAAFGIFVLLLILIGPPVLWGALIGAVVYLIWLAAQFQQRK